MEPLYNIKGPVLAERLSLFINYDGNNDGFVSKDELIVQFTVFKERARRYFPRGSIYTVQYIMDTFDMNNDNQLSFLDFNNCLTAVNSNNSGWTNYNHYTFFSKNYARNQLKHQFFF